MRCLAAITVPTQPTKVRCGIQDGEHPRHGLSVQHRGVDDDGKTVRVWVEGKPGDGRTLGRMSRGGSVSA